MSWKIRKGLICVFLILLVQVRIMASLNSTPTAYPGMAQTVKVGETVQFAGSGNDTDGAIVAYRWTFPVEAVYIQGSQQATAQCKFNRASDGVAFDVILEVQDDLGKWSDPASVLITVEPAGTDTWYVSPSGHDDHHGRDSENAFATIQMGIEVAQENDKVLVDQGIYRENINYLGKNIKVQSTDPENWSVVENTVIAPSGFGPAVQITGVQDRNSSLKGFTVTDGEAVESYLNPMAYWPLDSIDSGMTADIIGDHDGTVFGSTSVTDGVAGSAMPFDGINDYIDCGIPSELDSSLHSLSVSCWFRGADPWSGTYPHLISQRNAGNLRWSLYLDSSMGYRINGACLCKDNAGSSVTVVSQSDFIPQTGVWYHVTMTFDANNDRMIHLYINGAECDYLVQNVAPGSIVDNVTNEIPVVLGNREGEDRPFKGCLDEVKLFHRQISDSEIAQLASLGISHWPLDVDGQDNEGDHDATLSGAVISQVSENYHLGGGAAEFDNMDDYVDCGYPADLTDLRTFSVSCWFKATENTFLQSYPHLVSQRNTSAIRWSLYLNSSMGYRLSGAVCTDDGSGGNVVVVGQSDFIPQAGQWYHVTMTYDEAGDRKVYLYSNGTEATYLTQDTAPGLMVTDSTIPVTIGNRAGGGRSFMGYLDEVKLYRSILPAVEIIRQARQKNGGLNDLVVNWELNEASGTTTVDAIGGLTANCVNGASWQSEENLIQGPAVQLDGVNDHLNCGTGIMDGMSAFTVSLWFRADTISDTINSHLICQRNIGDNNNHPWSIQLWSPTSSEPKRLLGFVNGSQAWSLVETDFYPVAGRWYHLVMTYDDATERMVRLYVDGVETGYNQQSALSGARLTDSSLAITAGDCIDGGRAFDGMIDDIRIYGHALGVDAISNMYQLQGGGIFCYGSSPTISHCLIHDNQADTGGGGIFCYEGMPAIAQCFITNNQSQACGAGVYGAGSQVTLQNCVIKDNVAIQQGGGIYASEASEITIENCTIIKNRATSNPAVIDGNDSGAALCCADSETNMAILNTIIWENGLSSSFNGQTAIITDDDQAIDVQFGTSQNYTISYSCIQDKYTDDILVPFDGEANFNIDNPPSFKADGYHLRPDSPCIEKGSQAVNSTVDIDGNERTFDSLGLETYRADIGADEKICDTYYVDGGDTDGDGLSNGIGNDENSGSATEPFLTIGHAIKMARDGDVIIVKPGTYYELLFFNYKPCNTNIGDNIIDRWVSFDPDYGSEGDYRPYSEYVKDITVRSEYLENESALMNTIITGRTMDGNISRINESMNNNGEPVIGYEIGSVITFGGFESQNTVLAGFTITGGGGTARYINSRLNQVRGGGINSRALADAPEYYNQAGSSNYSKATILNCIIRNNPCDVRDFSDIEYLGGGIFQMSGLIQDCLITHNIFREDVASTGGGIYSIMQKVVVDRCVIENNCAWYGGGAVISGTITNSVITGNIAYENNAGLAIYIGGDSNIDMRSRVINCTIARNICLSDSAGQGMKYLQHGSGPDNDFKYLYINNSIISKNFLCNCGLRESNIAFKNSSASQNIWFMNNLCYFLPTASLWPGINYESNFEQDADDWNVDYHFHAENNFSIDPQFVNPYLLCDHLPRTGQPANDNWILFRIPSYFEIGDYIEFNGNGMLYQVTGCPQANYREIEGIDGIDDDVSMYKGMRTFIRNWGKVLPSSLIPNWHLQEGSPCKDAGVAAAFMGHVDIDGDSRVINGIPDIGADEICVVTNHSPVASLSIASPEFFVVNDTTVIHDMDDIEGVAVVFDGSQSSDPDDGDVIEYIWTCNGQLLAGETGQTLTLNCGWGEHVIGLTVTDQADASSGPAEITVVINRPPVADAGEDQIVHITDGVSAEVSLDGSGSLDPENGELSYEWQDENGNVIGQNDQVSLTLAAGSYTYTLVVSDGYHAAGFDTVAIIVNTPPQAVIHVDNTVMVDDDQDGTALVTFTSESSDVDLQDSIQSYLWTDGNDQPYPDGTGSSIELRLALGSHTVKLFVMDSRGATGSAEVTVEVIPPFTLEAGKNKVITLPELQTLLSGAKVTGSNALSWNWETIFSPAGITVECPTDEPDAEATFTIDDAYFEVFDRADLVLKLNGADRGEILADQIKVSIMPDMNRQSAPKVQINNVSVGDTGNEQQYLWSLNATIQDDGKPFGILSAYWEKVSGPGDVLFNAEQHNKLPVAIEQINASAVEAVFTCEGVYILKLTASDGEKTGFDLVSIEVGPDQTNTPPRIYWGVESDPTDNKLILDTKTTAEQFKMLKYDLGTMDTIPLLTIEDQPEGLAELTYLWTLVRGDETSITIEDPEILHAIADFTKCGHYVFRLEVSDGQFTSYDLLDIEIVSENPIYSIDAGDYQVTYLPRNFAYLYGIVDTSNESVEQITWSLKHAPIGAEVAIDNSDSIETKVHFQDYRAGIYIFALKVLVNDIILEDNVTVRVESTYNISCSDSYDATYIDVHALCINSDHTTKSIGCNRFTNAEGEGGALGWDNTYDSSWYPYFQLVHSNVQNSGSYLTGIIAISTGAYNSMAIDLSGNLYSWGWSDYDISLCNCLGNTRIPQKMDFGIVTEPIIIGMASNAHSRFAYDSLGRAWFWGCSFDGESGCDDDSNGYFNTALPKNINDVSSLQNVINISTSHFWRTFFLDDGIIRDGKGKVYSCGHYYGGMLGIGSINSNIVSPLPVHRGSQLYNDSDYLENIVSISAGKDHVLALEMLDDIDSNEYDGRVLAWGLNSCYPNNCLLGTNDTELEVAYEPIYVNGGEQFIENGEQGSNILKNIISIDAGIDHSLALDKYGNVWSWGNNSYGQLGIESNSSGNEFKATPVKVCNVDMSDVISISAGNRVSFAKDRFGNVWVWGRWTSSTNNSTLESYLEPKLLDTGESTVINITQSKKYQTISMAVSEVVSNDEEIIVGAGDYNERIILSNEYPSMIIRSVQPDNWDEVQNTTIISPDAGLNIIEISHNDSTIKGLSIMGGKSGINCINEASPRIENCIIYGNSHSGIYTCGQSGPVISCNQIFDNSRYGICFENDDFDGYTYAGTPRIIGNIVSDNGEGMYHQLFLYKACGEGMIWNNTIDSPFIENPPSESNYRIYNSFSSFPYGYPQIFNNILIPGDDGKLYYGCDGAGFNINRDDIDENFYNENIFNSLLNTSGAIRGGCEIVESDLYIDINDQPRIMYNEQSGNSNIDFGAYEYSPLTISAGVSRIIDYPVGQNQLSVWFDDAYVKLKDVPYNSMSEISYEWSVISQPEGSNVAFSNSSVLNPQVTFTYDLPGTYRLLLKVKDNVGRVVGGDTVWIALARNEVIQAQIKIDDEVYQKNQNIVLGGDVELSGMINGIANASYTSSWSVISGPSSAHINDPSQTNTLVNFSEPGLYQFQFTVLRDLRLVGSDTVFVLVDHPVVTVEAGMDQILQLGSPGFVAGTQLKGSIAGEVPYAIVWQQISGPDGFMMYEAENHTLNPEVLFGKVGDYQIALIATNSYGDMIGADYVEICVQESTIELSASLENDAPAGYINLKGTLLGADPSQYTFKWSSPNGLFEFGNAQQLSTWAKVSGLAPGLYEVSLSAYDNTSQLVAIDILEVSISGSKDLYSPDWVDAGEDISLNLLQDNLNVQLSGMSTTPRTKWLYYGTEEIWLEDDSDLNTSITLPGAGDYPLYLLALDENDAIIDMDSLVISISWEPAISITAAIEPAVATQIDDNPVEILLIAQPELGADQEATYYNWYHSGTPDDVQITTRFNPDTHQVDYIALVNNPGQYVFSLELLSSQDNTVITGSSAIATINRSGIYVDLGPDRTWIAGQEPVSIYPMILGDLPIAYQGVSGYYLAWQYASDFDFTAAAGSGENENIITFEEGIQTSGKCRVTLNVYEDLGTQGPSSEDQLIGSDFMVIEIYPENSLPIVYAGRNRSILLTEAQVSISLDDVIIKDDILVLGDNGLEVIWTAEPDIYSIDTTAPDNPEITFNRPGLYKITVSVKDHLLTALSQDDTATDTVVIYVGADTEGILVNAGEDQTVTWPQNEIWLKDAWVLPADTQVQWQITNGIAFDPSNTVINPFVSFQEPSDYDMTIVANEDSNISDSITVSVLPRGEDQAAPTIDSFTGTYNNRASNIDNDNSVTGSITVNADAHDEDGGSGIQVMILKLSNGQILCVEHSNALTCEFSTAHLRNGSSYTLTLEAIDNAGNRSSSTKQFGVQNQFSVSPRVVEDYPQVLTFNMTVPWSKIVLSNGYEFEADDQNATTYITDDAWLSDLTEEDDGTWIATLYDVSGNPLAETVKFILALGKPVAKISNLNPVDDDDDLFGDNNLLNIHVDGTPPTIIQDGLFTLMGKAYHRSANSDIEYLVEIFDDNGTFYRNLTPGYLINGYRRQRIGNENDTGILGELDLTNVPNGVYNLKLVVRCHGHYDTDETQIALSSSLKIGNVQFTQEDLVIPIGGVPIRVSRTYNSLHKDYDSEFGYGWSYSFANLDMQLNERRITKSEDNGKWTCRMGGDFDRDVTLTLPDGRRVVFAYTLLPCSGPGTNNWKVVYQAPDGVNDVLETSITCKLCYGGGMYGVGYFWAIGNKYNIPLISNAPLNLGIQDFPGYKLTLQDGTVYNFERKDYGSHFVQGYDNALKEEDLFEYQAYGKPFLASIEMTSGDKIEFIYDENSDGEHPRCVEVKSCLNGNTSFSKSITLDWEDNRISKVNSPNHTQAPLLSYEYDSSGNLKYVHKLDETGEPEETVEYCYDGENRNEDGQLIARFTPEDHYITDIIDPRGLKPIRYLYDDQGRLTGTIDAKGNQITLSHAISGKTETVYSRSDPDKTNPTIYAYDERGNVVSETRIVSGAPARETLYGYSSVAQPDRPTSVTQKVPNPENYPEVPVDAVTRYEYYNYPGTSKLYHEVTIDPVNNVSITVYDEKGRVDVSISGKNAALNGDGLLVSYDPVSVTVNEYRVDLENRDFLRSTAQIKPESQYFANSAGILPVSEILQIPGAILSRTEYEYEQGRICQVIQDIDDNPTNENEIYTTYWYNVDVSNSFDQPYSVSEPHRYNETPVYRQFSKYDANGNQVESWTRWQDPAETSVIKRILNKPTLDRQGRTTQTKQLVYDESDMTQVSERTLSETVYNCIGQVDYTIDENRNLTRYYYDELGQVVETVTARAPASGIDVDSYLNDPANILTVSQTLYDVEGRTLVSVDTHEYGQPATATETVYDALGQVERTRRWANVRIHLETFVDKTCRVAGKRVPANYIAGNAWASSEDAGESELAWWVVDGQTRVQPVAGNELSYSRTEYDCAGRTSRAVVLDDGGYERVTGYRYDLAGRQIMTLDHQAFNLDDTTDYRLEGKWHVIDTDLNSIAVADYDYEYTARTAYDGNQRKYTYEPGSFDANGGISEPDGSPIYRYAHRTEYSYDEQGRLITTQLPSVDGIGITFIHVGYDVYGRKEWETEPTIKTLGALTNNDKKQYEYDPVTGQLIKVTLPDPDDGTEHPSYRYIYDQYGNQVAKIDPLWRITVSKYNEFQQQTVQYQPFLYSDNYSDVEVIEAFEELDTADEIYNELNTNHGSTLFESWQYDEQNRLKLHTDYEEQAVAYLYNNDGRLEEKRYYAEDDTDKGNYLNQNYDDSEDNWSEKYHYDYDNLGRLWQTTKTVAGEDPVVVEEIDYDFDGQIESITTPQGVVNYGYNLITGQKNRTWTHKRDDSTTVYSDTQYEYDCLNRLESANDNLKAMNNRYGYNEAGSRKSMELGNSVSPCYHYDALHRLTGLHNYDSKYDALTNPNPGVLSSFIYTHYADGLRHSVTEQVQQNGSTENRVVTYSYDLLNRLIDESSLLGGSDEYQIEYGYDLVGNRSSRTVTVGGQELTTTYSYNDRDQLEYETQSGPVCAYDIGEDRIYAYHDHGDITYTMAGHEGRIGGFKAFAMGLPTRMDRYLWQLLLVITLAMMLAPVLITAIIYHVRKGQGCEIKPRFGLATRGISVFLAYLFIISPAMLRQSCQAAVSYDQISACDWGRNGRVIQYAYDDNGSLISRLTLDSGAESESVSYRYNLQNRLERVVTNDGFGELEIVEYDYNEAGIRVSALKYTAPALVDNEPTARNNPQMTFYLIDPANPTGYAQVAAELAYNQVDPDPATTSPDSIRSYTIGDDVLAQDDNPLDGYTTPDTLLYDGQGSTRQLVNQDQTVIKAYSYDGYGNLLGGNPTAAPATNLLYTGEQYDSALGQYYLRARYYDPANGRFNRMDPYAGNISDPQSLHKYLYCHGNPVNGVDPSGHFTVTELMVVTTILSIAFGTILSATSGYRNKLEKDLGSIESCSKPDAISYLGQVRDEYEKDLLEIKDPDLRAMAETFYINLGYNNQVVMYNSLLAEKRFLDGIEMAYHASNTINAGLSLGSTLAGMSTMKSLTTKVMWSKPHPTFNEHWATIKWNVVNRQQLGFADEIYTHSSISRITKGAIKSRKMPDWAEVLPNGKLNLFEVPSPGQNDIELLEKGWYYRQILGDRLNKFEVVEIGQLY